MVAGVSPASVPSQLQPTPLDALTASGSDPFNSSFFDLSFGTSQPVTTTTTAAVSHDSNNFDNPVFNASTDKAESTPEDEMSVALTSTPEGKQLTYQSRPRPKGKVLDGPIAFSPAPLSEITNGTDTGGRAVRDISLSPTREQEVKSILANTDPFQSPTNFDAFQSPPPAINGSGPFESAPFPQTPDSSFFSFSAQDSIQLVNPLYQSPSLDGSFSAPYISPPQSLQQPAIMMQPQPPVAPSPLMPLIQPPHMMTQPQPHPQLSNSMGANSFDGMFSPTIYSPPSTGESLWSAQSPPENASFIEQRDQMFADLLPLGAHSLPDKKKEFEPQKVTSPSLAELQDKKKREQEEAFIASTSTPKETLDEANEWPTSPFDDVTSTEIFPEPPLDRSPQLLPENLQAPTSTTKQQQNTQVNTLDDFDRAFQEASNKVEDIDSAFEVKITVIPQPQPSGPAANDPFVVNGSATSPELKNAPWSTF